MIDMNALLNRGIKEAIKNTPEILTALGIAGVATTAYLTAKATLASKKKLEVYSPDTTNVEKVKIIWPELIPPILAGTATIACIYGSHRSSSKRTAAAIAAYSLSDKAFAEYRAKVEEKLTEKKAEEIKDEVAAEKVKATSVIDTQIPFFPSGDVLCCDLLTMRYFQSSIEHVKKSVNELNAKLLREDWATVAEFYHILGVRPTDHMDRLGWTKDHLMEVTFTSVLTEEEPQRPCAAFAYNYVKPV